MAEERVEELEWEEDELAEVDPQESPSHMSSFSVKLSSSSSLTESSLTL